MRKRISLTILAAFALGLISCRGTIIRGSGNSITETRDVSGFNKIVLEGQGDLIVTVGEPESLTMEGDDNLVELTTTRVRGNELRIGFSKTRVDIRPNLGVTHRITVPSLEGLTITGVSEATLNNLQDDINVVITGAANVTANGTIEALKVDLNGAGNFRGAELNANEAKVTINGTGSARVHAIDSLEANINGAGSINYSGEASVNRNISGVGDIARIDG